MIEELVDEINSSDNILEINKNDDQILLKIEKLKSDYDSLMDKYLRALSEIENMNKRAVKDREDMMKYSISSFVKDLIPLIDNLERAISVEKKEENSKFISGISIILNDVIKSFSKHGVEKIEVNVGDDFNPEFHHAVSVLQSNVIKSGKIIEKFLDGYKLEDRIIRACLVSVSE